MTKSTCHRKLTDKLTVLRVYHCPIRVWVRVKVSVGGTWC